MLTNIKYYYIYGIYNKLLIYRKCYIDSCYLVAVAFLELKIICCFVNSLRLVKLLAYRALEQFLKQRVLEKFSELLDTFVFHQSSLQV